MILQSAFTIIIYPSKGQLISKGLFAMLNSSKKTNKKLDFTTVIPQLVVLILGYAMGRIVFGRFFWKNWRHQKDILKLTDL